MLFNKNDIPFFGELVKTKTMIYKDNNTYDLYEAPNWDIAAKVDKLMNSRNEIGLNIDNYKNDNFNKVDAPIINADGNVFNLIGICRKALKNEGYDAMADELSNRVTNSNSYNEALSIMMEYVNPVDKYDYDNMDISI